jgi:hypothetical protein
MELEINARDLQPNDKILFTNGDLQLILKPTHTCFALLSGHQVSNPDVDDVAGLGKVGMLALSEDNGNVHVPDVGVTFAHDTARVTVIRPEPPEPLAQTPQEFYDNAPPTR